MRLGGVALPLLLLGLSGCVDNPYVIGRLPDAGSRDDCAAGSGSALVCSGFEAAGLSDWSLPMLERSAQVEQTGAHVHHGHLALHARSRAAMSVAVVASTFPAVRSGSVYFRLYVYLPAGVSTQTINILFLGDEPGPQTFAGLDFNLQDGALQVYSAASEAPRRTGTVEVPRDRWFCLRAHVAVSGERGSVQLYVDDALALDAANLVTLPSAGLRQFRAGVGWSSEQTELFEVYMDDVLVDTAPVSCTP